MWAGAWLLGGTGLKYWPQFSETELGWVLRPDAWGHGYATEGGRASAQWRFQNLDVPYLKAMISPDNHRSIAVAHRLEMSPLRSDTLLGEPSPSTPSIATDEHTQATPRWLRHAHA